MTGGPVSERNALLAAVRADPNADLPRLVYADWLDDRGEAARAEFIRLQCAAAAASSLPHKPVIRVRERELLRRHYHQWVAEDLTERVADHVGRIGVVFERGFVSGLRATWPVIAANAKWLLTTVPVVELDLVGPVDAVAFAATPGLTALRRLQVSGSPLGDGGFERLVMTAAAMGVESLGAIRCEVSADGLDALVRAYGPHRRGLRDLELVGNPLGPAGVRRLEGIMGPGRGALSLNLADCGLGSDGAADVARLARISPIRWLSLASNQVSDLGVESLLVDTSRWEHLAYLNLYGNPLTRACHASIARLVTAAGTHVAGADRPTSPFRRQEFRGAVPGGRSSR